METPGPEITNKELWIAFSQSLFVGAITWLYARGTCLFEWDFRIILSLWFVIATVWILRRPGPILLYCLLQAFMIGRMS